MYREVQVSRVEVIQMDLLAALQPRIHGLIDLLVSRGIEGGTHMGSHMWFLHNLVEASIDLIIYPQVFKDPADYPGSTFAGTNLLLLSIIFIISSLLPFILTIIYI